jgi:O-methyltransferase involved in polyketide biosynthesis
MKHKISLEKIKGVSKTLLIPLRGRYLETKRADGIVDDPKSVEIIDSIEHDFTELELPWVGQIMVAARTEILDEATEKFLARYPDSVVVNLGCGLDTRVHRVDNGLVLWYDLDFPECIKLREKFFQQTGRFKFIAKSVLDFSWVNDIEKNKRTLFIAEGLFNYLHEEDIKNIFLTIKNNFPFSEIIFEAYSSLITRSWHKHPHIKNAFSMFKWGLDTGKSLEEWDQSITFLREWPYLDRHPKRWKWMRHFRHFRSLRRLMKIVHLKFNDTGHSSEQKPFNNTN